MLAGLVSLLMRVLFFDTWKYLLSCTYYVMASLKRKEHNKYGKTIYSSPVPAQKSCRP